MLHRRSDGVVQALAVSVSTLADAPPEVKREIAGKTHSKDAAMPREPTETPATGGDAPILIYATFPSLEAAERIGAALVDRGLAACVNILPGMVSIYRWQGRRCRDAETAMLIKTRQALAERVSAEVRDMHSYDNPAIVAIALTGGSPDFLRWIGEQTADPA